MGIRIRWDNNKMHQTQKAALVILSLAVKYKHQLKISLVLNCKLVYILSCQIKNKRRINEL